MSDETKKLYTIIEQQEHLLAELKSQADRLDNDSVAKQNEILKKEVADATDKNNSLQNENADLKKELSAAKGALFNKMANEKLAVFSRVQAEIDEIYYQKQFSANSRLDEYRNGCIKSINEVSAAIEKYGSQEYSSVLQRLESIKNEMEQIDKRVKQYSDTEFANAVKVNNSVGDRLANEPITENEKRTALKQKSLESFIGLNVLSKAGILLFLIGIIMLGRFAYVHMSNVFKGGLIFALGAVLIAVGEMFHKKEKSVFSVCLVSGGVAVLYAAAATCYFAFNLYGARMTFVLCIVITAIAILLSHQTKSQVVCAFGAVGGYLPVVSAFMITFGKAASDRMFLPVSSAYFCVLAVIIFVMTYNKKWYAAQFIGYSLHIVALGGIARCAWALKNIAGYEYALPLAAGFAIVSFVIYLMMPAVKIFADKPIGMGDLVLLALNTVSGAVSVSITLHNCFEKGVANRNVGIVFLLFALIYAVLMLKSTHKKDEKSNASTSFLSLSALVFSMLVVPYMFGLIYGPVAWTFEGAVLAVLGIQRKIKATEYVGFSSIIFSAILAFSLYLSDELGTVLTLVTFGVIVACVWMYCIVALLSDKKNIEPYRLLEIGLGVSTFLYVKSFLSYVVESPAVSVYSDFLFAALMILIAVAVAVIIRVGILKSKATVIFSNIVGVVLAPITALVLNIFNSYNDFHEFYGKPIESTALVAVNIGFLIAVNIIVALFFANSVGSLLNITHGAMWIYTAAISISALMQITSILMSQFNVAFSSVVLSGIYIVSACALLFIGFKKRYTVVRSGGLVIILCAIAKLCFVDTMHLDSGWKIASYFAFGAMLIVISYFYQRFSKKLHDEAVNEIDKTN